MVQCNKVINEEKYMKKSMNAKLREAKADAKYWEEEFYKQRDQKLFHRKFIEQELQKQLECKNSQYWSPQVVIERIARHMAASKNWYW